MKKKVIASLIALAVVILAIGGLLTLNPETEPLAPSQEENQVSDQDFIKSEEFGRKAVNLRKRYLEDLKAQNKDIERKPLASPSGEPLNLLEFPSVEINEREVCLDPEINKSRADILEDNATFFQELLDDVNRVWHSDLSAEKLCQQQNLNRVAENYLPQNDSHLDKDQVMELLNELTLVNNACNNNKALRLIYEKKYKEYDQTANQNRSADKPLQNGLNANKRPLTGNR